MFSSILEVITIGAKIFSVERQAYFKNESKRLMQQIYKVEDTGFYSKDMEAKGKAEREIERQTAQLMSEFISEGQK